MTYEENNSGIMVPSTVELLAEIHVDDGLFALFSLLLRGVDSAYSAPACLVPFRNGGCGTVRNAARHRGIRPCVGGGNVGIYGLLFSLCIGDGDRWRNSSRFLVRVENNLCDNKFNSVNISTNLHPCNS